MERHCDIVIHKRDKSRNYCFFEIILIIIPDCTEPIDVFLCPQARQYVLLHPSSRSSRTSTQKKSYCAFKWNHGTKTNKYENPNERGKRKKKHVCLRGRRIWDVISLTVITQLILST
ncbi:hypothetical protein GDO78_001043 [Eleutherodactylus coqui]|uniref:Uncharacterized protein n=1 Tax=Eleutherodactylus coqui TaxID=57060 RepID=A0A8J6KH66_ELECQ|nr:hypothetical protein GDO78_001043 [Eleutherodactylus coqui]